MTVRSQIKLIILIAAALVFMASGAVSLLYGPGRAMAEKEPNATDQAAPKQPQIITVTPRGAYTRAIVEARSGNHEQALELYAQIPDLIPESMADDLAWRRAESLSALGRREEAIKQLRLCLKLSPRGPRSRACRELLKTYGGLDGEGEG